MDSAKISGMKVEALKNFLRLRGLRTYEEVDLLPQNPFQSPECAVHRSGVFPFNKKRFPENANFLGAKNRGFSQFIDVDFSYVVYTVMHYRFIKK